MDFLTCFYRQQSEYAASVLLQQYQWKQMHVLFACVCAGGEEAAEDGRNMSRGLRQWFRGLDLKRLTSLFGLAERLEEAIERIDLEQREMREALMKPVNDFSGKKCFRDGENADLAEAVKADITGVFCIEDECLLFYRGSGRIYLMNTAFGRGHVRRLDKGAEGCRLRMEQGVLQQDVGLLLAAEPFFTWVTEKMLAEGLFVGEAVTEEQMEKHLRELAREGERKGGLGSGAVFIRATDEKRL